MTVNLDTFSTDFSATGFNLLVIARSAKRDVAIRFPHYGTINLVPSASRTWSTSSRMMGERAFRTL